VQGDFLSDESQAIIKQCNIIFCNNYTFPSELNLQLKTIFENLPDGMYGTSGPNIQGPRFFVCVALFGGNGLIVFSLRLDPREHERQRHARAGHVLFLTLFLWEWRCKCLNDKRLPHLSLSSV
jgi:hypothetical protein